MNILAASRRGTTLFHSHASQPNFTQQHLMDTVFIDAAIREELDPKKSKQAVYVPTI